MSYSSDPAPFENYFVIFQLHKRKDESKNMDVFLMRIMKVERQVKHWRKREMWILIDAQQREMEMMSL